jgi:phosphonate transport system ATP-binding protein
VPETAAAPAAANSFIRLEGLTKVFPSGTRALDDVSLEVPRRQFLCVIGPSGSGKSTLLRCINRLLEPTTGRVWVGGEEVTALSGEALRHARRRTAMVFQQFNLVRRTTVLGNVLTGRLGYQQGWRRLIPGFSKADEAMAWASLERLEIAEKATVRADMLSGGQMQRVALARALAQQPEIMLADEPVASLDPETAVVVLDYLRDINRSDGITVLCAIHHLELAKRYADRIIAMRQGRLVYDGSPGDLDDAAYRRIYGRLGFD